MNHLVTIIFGLLGLAFLAALPPLGIVLLVIAVAGHMQATQRARNIQAMYDAQQAQKDRRARVLAFKSLP